MCNSFHSDAMFRSDRMNQQCISEMLCSDSRHWIRAEIQFVQGLRTADIRIETDSMAYVIVAPDWPSKHQPDDALPHRRFDSRTSPMFSESTRSRWICQDWGWMIIEPDWLAVHPPCILLLDQWLDPDRNTVPWVPDRTSMIAPNGELQRRRSFCYERATLWRSKESDFSLRNTQVSVRVSYLSSLIGSKNHVEFFTDIVNRK